MDGLVLEVHLKHFRCFDQLQLEIDAPFVLIEGCNGAGKTSVLEALYYACHLRSFRTCTSRDLVSRGSDGFFIRVTVRNEIDHLVSVGFAHGERLVKIDQKPISSYRELFLNYRAMSLTEDDLAVIKGGPQLRRELFDRFLLLNDPAYGATLRAYRQTVEQRNALLSRDKFDFDLYVILTRQVWEKSREIQESRWRTLAVLEEYINTLTQTLTTDSFHASLSYFSKIELGDSWDVFQGENRNLYAHERRLCRTLFGAHLDDVSILLNGNSARIFSSRGQQKLIILLIKIAQLKFLESKGQRVVFVIDDFMTDLDQKNASQLLDILVDLENQLIFTSPIEDGLLSDRAKSLKGKVTKLTH